MFKSSGTRAERCIETKVLGNRKIVYNVKIVNRWMELELEFLYLTEINTYNFFLEHKNCQVRTKYDCMG